ncbi:MAG TPA: class I SAM-dependent methyltransferase [Ferruginibacter sp.]|nr:class I SAM-dependent methyltransferase [Ferruginibacter sp.]
MDNYEAHFAANKESWNKRTAIHKDSTFYDLDAFKKGKSSLNKIELEELGDVSGKTLLHLQCHFGMDTMSWQRMGANCTGVDLSDEAIKLANQVNDELQLKTNFVCSNVYDLKENLHGQFDIVFTSYGTIGWLPDLDKWADIVAHFLKPGGTFYIADFHPVLWMMDENFQHIKYDYFNTAVIEEEQKGTYTDRDAPIRSMEYSWNHPFSEILGALIRHGLSIQQFHEFPFSPYNCFNNVEQGTDGMWRIKGMDEKMPMMYSIMGVRQLNG